MQGVKACPGLPLALGLCWGRGARLALVVRSNAGNTPSDATLKASVYSVIFTLGEAIFIGDRLFVWQQHNASLTRTHGVMIFSL